MNEGIDCKKGRHALVLGGGIAGLISATVLARHFEEVTLLEQDSYSTDPSTVRLHTPHGAHIHGILAAGLQTMSRLYPDLPRWFDEMGIYEGDLTHHTRIAYEGRWLPRVRSGIAIRVCTRSEAEDLLRREVTRIRNVRILERCKVQALNTARMAGKMRVRGITFSREGGEEELNADFIVDAMGRNSPSKRWLEKLFMSGIEELEVNAGIVYASAWFHTTARIDDDWSVLWTLPSMPNDPRMGVIIRFGQDRLLFSMIGYGKPKAPHTHDELVARTADLCVPELHRLLKASRPTSEIAIYGNTQNRWRRYGRLPSFIDGLAVLGDAACSLNPRYGQGIALATIGADLLDRELSGYFAAHGNLDGFSHHFQKSLDRMLQVPWQIAVMEDRAWLAARSETKLPVAQRIAIKGSQRLLMAAMSDIDLYIRFMRVAQLLDPPTKILTPKTIAKIALNRKQQSEFQDRPNVGIGIG